ncbi:MAG: erythromycin esterase family protein [Bradymonadaceae bacterium]
MDPDAALVDALERQSHPLEGESSDLDAIVEQCEGERIVLAGEATHGTREFYSVRAELTRRLIGEQGFDTVAVEADWPDACREDLDPEKRVGFYGLDLYSLHRSAEAVVEYLEEIDEAAAERARERYACFDHVDADPQAYGMAAVHGPEGSCEEEVVEQLVDLRRRRATHLQRDGLAARDEQFYAEQNARVAKDAEAYYRAMFRGDLESWNVRDRHMFGTLEDLIEHRRSTVGTGKVVVWEHNSHLGDARATTSSRRGQINVGQLVNETYGDDAISIGMTTYDGTVSAASNWDEPVDHKYIRPARDDSHEGLFHRLPHPYFTIDLGDESLRTRLIETRYQRAIGVIYRPETELMSHYFKAQLPYQFDALVHVDRTHALEPLDRTAGWKAGEEEDLPETYPSGL